MSGDLISPDNNSSAGEAVSATNGPKAAPLFSFKSVFVPLRHRNLLFDTYPGSYTELIPLANLDEADDKEREKSEKEG